MIDDDGDVGVLDDDEEGGAGQRLLLFQGNHVAAGKHVLCVEVLRNQKAKKNCSHLFDRHACAVVVSHLSECWCHKQTDRDLMQMKCKA